MVFYLTTDRVLKERNILLALYLGALGSPSIYIKLHVRMYVLHKSQRNLYLTYSATLVRAKRATRIRGGLPPRKSSITIITAQQFFQNQDFPA